MKNNWNLISSSQSDQDLHQQQSQHKHQAVAEKLIKQEQLQLNHQQRIPSPQQDMLEKLDKDENFHNKQVQILNCTQQQLVSKIQKHNLICKINKFKQNSYIASFNTKEDLRKFIQEKMKNKYSFNLQLRSKTQTIQVQQKNHDKKQKSQNNTYKTNKTFFWKNYDLYINEDSVSYVSIIQSIDNRIIPGFEKIRIYIPPKFVKWVFKLIDIIFQKYQFRVMIQKEQLLKIAKQCKQKYMEIVIKQIFRKKETNQFETKSQQMKNIKSPAEQVSSTYSFASIEMMSNFSTKLKSQKSNEQDFSKRCQYSCQYSEKSEKIVRKSRFDLFNKIELKKLKVRIYASPQRAVSNNYQENQNEIDLLSNQVQNILIDQAFKYQKWYDRYDTCSPQHSGYFNNPYYFMNMNYMSSYSQYQCYQVSPDNSGDLHQLQHLRRSFDICNLVETRKHSPKTGNKNFN